ncbi:MAG: hypothetical protein WA239_28645, partial [Candidatus Sulfotelmatobacter sp.]
MRKWMRERLQRRKKTPAGPSDQPTPPPLQPAYFDAEQAPGGESESASESESSVPPQPVPEPRSVRRTSSSEPPSEAQPPAS